MEGRTDKEGAGVGRASTAESELSEPRIWSKSRKLVKKMMLACKRHLN